jgi:UDP-N-acetylmuramate--alanine ligase
MITHILIETGKDPSYIIGGVLSTTGQNAGVGKGDAFVVEADEYDNMFLGLRPDIAVVTNVEWDHPDFFPTESAMMESFRQFAERITPQGALIACGDDAGALRLALDFAGRRGRRIVMTYGISSSDDSRIQNLRTENGCPAFDYDISTEGDPPLHVRLSVPGRHNALNAAAALEAVMMFTYRYPLDDSALLEALSTFKGTARRFELKGEVDGIAVIDDYAHHPTKIRATLEAARSRYPDRQIWAVWQPHTYSRTQALMDDYLNAFKDADHVLITDIYAAREQPIPSVSAAEIAARMDHPDARFTATFDEAVAALVADVKPPAAAIIMSAGDAPQIGVEFLKRRGKD